jgi:hypothetical protein
MVEPAETLGDGFADIVFTARHGLPITLDRATPGEVNPAVVDEDAGGQFMFDDDLGLVVDAVARGAVQPLDHILDGLFHGGDLAFAAVFVGEGFQHLGEVLVARRRHPLQHIQGAVGAEGHADRVNHRRLLRDNLQAQALGRAVAFESRVELTLVNEL